MPENIIIQPNKPLYVRLSDPMNTENFDFETREGRFTTSSGQVLTLPRPAVLRLYVLEPAPGEEIEILKKWSGKRGDPAIWSVRRAQEPMYTAAGGWTESGIKEQERRAQETASEPGTSAAPDSLGPAVEASQEAPTPIRRPSRQPAPQDQPGLFDIRGTGTYGPMPAGVAYAAPKPRLVPARRPPAEVIPWNVAFREVSEWVSEILRENHLQWSDVAQKNAVCTVLIAEAKKGRIGPWERGK